MPSSNNSQKAVGIFSSGIWKNRTHIAQILDMKPKRLHAWRTLFPHKKPDSVAGWGHKPTAQIARGYAQHNGLDYIALEDGFLRSLHPGSGEVPLSYVVDHSGIYYDAHGSSDIEKYIINRAKAGLTPEGSEQALQQLIQTKISKYNNAPLSLPVSISSQKGNERVLLVDQTAGDSSIALGLSDENSFTRMLKDALADNPTKHILIKTHPEVIAGTKQGHLSPAQVRQIISIEDYARIQFIGDLINPYTLFEVVDKVYTVTSQMGMEALFAGKQVITYGAPFYAFWGLTDDRLSDHKTIDLKMRRSARPSLLQFFTATYLDYLHYGSVTDKRAAFFEILEILGVKRDMFLEGSSV